MKISLAAFVAGIALACTGCPSSQSKAPTASQASPTAPVAVPNPERPAVPAPQKQDPATVTASQPAASVPPSTPEKDPVLLNGPIFEGWTKPQFALVITGEQFGYLEPCGCAGLENQKGGVSRRHDFLNQLRAKGWPLVPVDNGGLIGRFGRQQEIKYGKTAQALKIMDYQAIGFGKADLQLPAGEVLSAIAEDGGSAIRYVSANVGLIAFEAGLTPRYRVVEAGGRRVGITAVLGDRFQREINNSEVQLLPAEKGLTEVLPKLKAESDYLVLLAHATREESTALARRFPEFNVVVSAGGTDEPPATASQIDGSETLLVEVGHKGMYAIVLGLYEKEKAVQYQRVPLDARFKETLEMKRLMVEYQAQLEAIGFDELGLRPSPHPSGASFVGAEACADCHTNAYAVWKETPHTHSTDTLVSLKPPRHFDPECVSCHVTGWQPDKFFPFETGYASLEATPKMRQNGCENCHGPGSAHVAAEHGDTKASQFDLLKFREQMKLTLKDAEASCVKCHDPDNSPEFNFETYWPKVEHRGKD